MYQILTRTPELNEEYYEDGGGELANLRSNNNIDLKRKKTLKK